MRLYAFVNMYLSPIQMGIQAQHCTAELFVKYRDQQGHLEGRRLFDWAEHHKTSILLNGGNCASLKETHLLLHSSSGYHRLPFTCFFEDDASLNRALTCVSIIVPEKIYNVSADIAKGLIQPLHYEIDESTGTEGYTLFPTLNYGEQRIATLLSQHGLAK